MEHQIGEQHISPEFTGDKAAFVENELRRLCNLLGFKMEPLASQSDAIASPVSFRPSVLTASVRSAIDPTTQQRRARARLVRDEIRKRRQRDRFFPSDLFADPAWDILLDLYASHLEGRNISVSSACIAAAVPATTALRWLKTLSDNGQIVRVPDVYDGRRIFVAISEDSKNQLDAYFEEWSDQ
ncbi:winged helix DNA-binding protein [Sphingopyxis sp.]|uniref:winged helix DNA-binding protein n=1 Tax=Sphingopyxis sp. TaxID=1908224 RepID=UPI003D6CF555